MGTAVCPRRLLVRGMRLATLRVRGRSVGGTHREWRGTAPGRSARGPNCRRPKRRCAGGDGNLVRLFLLVWTAPHGGMQWRAIGQLCVIPFNTLSLRTVLPLDPAWPLASAARPPAPHLAARPRRYPRSGRRGHRQSLQSLGAELFCPRHRLRQEDPRHPRRQDPDGS
jgi:hypothetical protein